MWPSQSHMFYDSGGKSIDKKITLVIALLLIIVS